MKVFQKVMIVILASLFFSCEKNDDDPIWMSSISNNPAFDFLTDFAEDVYSLKDGEPFND